jgi:hypothetical protein
MLCSCEIEAGWPWFWGFWFCGFLPCVFGFRLCWLGSARSHTACLSGSGSGQAGSEGAPFWRLWEEYALEFPLCCLVSLAQPAIETAMASETSSGAFANGTDASPGLAFGTGSVFGMGSCLVFMLQYMLPCLNNNSESKD